MQYFLFRLLFVRTIMIRGRPFNLGCCILPLKVASDTYFRGRLWADLAEILMDFPPRVSTNVH